MKKRYLLRRIEALETIVAALQARPYYLVPTPAEPQPYGITWSDGTAKPIGQETTTGTPTPIGSVSVYSVGKEN